MEISIPALYKMVLISIVLRCITEKLLYQNAYLNYTRKNFVGHKAYLFRF